MKRLFIPIIALCYSGAVMAQNYDLPMVEGRFEATDESLATYEYPEWFRDAKFGIWSHWGPQAVPRMGDWYAKNMYLYRAYKGEDRGKNHPMYLSHIKNYGHPTKVGYKDIIPLWKAERWDPAKLMKLYKRVGAKYFVSMAVHHDNFFLWDSKIHKWNSVKMGPKKDVVGLWQAEAKKQGLYFGVSEHLGASYTWFSTSHGSDGGGQYKGVPYDGADPKYKDLYHDPLIEGDNEWLTNNPLNHQKWYYRIKELVDNYQPDLLYSDSQMPFGDVGRSMIASLYNSKLDESGHSQAIYNCKEESNGRFVRDMESGAMDHISPYPWQTDTSIGDWYYKTGQKYSTSTQIVQMLVDIVSKNGNLLLNVVQTPEGDLEDDIMEILDGIANWMDVNGEAIYGTRPWSVFGEGPSMKIAQEKGHWGGLKSVRDYLPGDIRFTQKGNTLYAFSMLPPEADITIESIGKREVLSVKILGSRERVKWVQRGGKLTITKPEKALDYDTMVFKIEL